MTSRARSCRVTSQPPSAGSQETGAVARSRASRGCGSAVSSSTVALAPIGYLTQATLRPVLQRTGLRGGPVAARTGGDAGLRGCRGSGAVAEALGTLRGPVADELAPLRAARVVPAQARGGDAHRGDHVAGVVIDGRGDAEDRLVGLALVVGESGPADHFEVGAQPGGGGDAARHDAA